MCVSTSETFDSNLRLFAVFDSRGPRRMEESDTRLVSKGTRSFWPEKATPETSQGPEKQTMDLRRVFYCTSGTTRTVAGLPHPPTMKLRRLLGFEGTMVFGAWQVIGVSISSGDPVARCAIRAGQACTPFPSWPNGGELERLDVHGMIVVK